LIAGKFAIRRELSVPDVYLIKAGIAIGRAGDKASDSAVSRDGSCFDSPMTAVVLTRRLHVAR